MKITIDYRLMSDNDKVVEAIAFILIMAIKMGSKAFKITKDMLSILSKSHDNEIDVIAIGMTLTVAGGKARPDDAVVIDITRSRVRGYGVDSMIVFDKSKGHIGSEDEVKDMVRSLLVKDTDVDNSVDSMPEEVDGDELGMVKEDFNNLKDVIRNIITIEKNVPQGLALKELVEGKGHMFITGRAGSGKSTFLRRVFPFLDNAVIVAPTGVASLNIGGATIHSCFGLPIDPYCPVVNPSRTEFVNTCKFNPTAYKMKKVKMVIIDEISMVRPDLLDCLADVLRQIKHNDSDPFGGVRIIMFGDLSQLPPVTSNDDPLYTYYDSRFFFSSKALRASGFKVFNFDKVFRQKDPTFLEVLDEVKSGELSVGSEEILNSRVGTPQNMDNVVTICSTNMELQAINNENLMRINGEEHTFNAVIKNVKPTSAPCEEILRLKVGAKVVITKNGLPDYVNGSVGKVTGFITEEDMEKDDTPVDTFYDDAINRKNDKPKAPRLWDSDIKGIKVQIMSTGKEVDIYPNTWEKCRYVPRETMIEKEVIGSIIQLPVRLGYAVTAHRSQGMTLDNVFIDMTRSFESGQTYTALSRCRSLEGLYLKNRITSDMVRKDPMISEFLGKVEANKGVVMPEKLKDIMGKQKPMNKYGIDFSEFGL